MRVEGIAAVVIWMSFGLVLGPGVLLPGQEAQPGPIGGLSDLTGIGPKINSDRHRKLLESNARLVEEMRQETFEESARNIGATGPHYPGHLLLYSSPTQRTNMDLPIVLGSRRFSRLDAWFRELPVENRPASCRSMFEAVFQDYQAAVEQRFRRFANPPDTSVELDKPLLSGRWGICCALFLMARYGALEDLVNSIVAVHEYSLGVVKRRRDGQHHQSLALRIDGEVSLDPDVRGNALLMALERPIADAERGAPGSGAETRKRLQTIRAALDQATVSVYPWEELLIPTDETYGLQAKLKAQVRPVWELTVYGPFTEELVADFLQSAARECSGSVP